jgi:hypothetical protein
MYCFLIYSSKKIEEGVHVYEYGYATHSMTIVGDKPFSRGDVAEVLSYKRESRNEFRITTKILGDPQINPGFSSSERIEIPTLLFLSSRIYLSEFSSYEIVNTVNAQILNFEEVKQDQNKIYAVAALVSGAESHIIAQDPNSKVRWEWVINDSDSQRRRW